MSLKSPYERNGRGNVSKGKQADVGVLRRQIGFISAVKNHIQSILTKIKLVGRLTDSFFRTAMLD